MTAPFSRQWSRWLRFSTYLFSPVLPGADRTSWLWTLLAAAIFSASVPMTRFGPTVGHLFFIGQFLAILIPATRRGWVGALAGFLLSTAAFFSALGATFALPDGLERAVPDIRMALSIGLAQLLVCGFLGNTIRRQRLLVEQLARAEARIGGMVDAMPLGMLVLDRKGNVIFSNSAARTLLCTDAPEEFGVHIRLMVAPDAWPLIRPRLLDPVPGELLRITIPGEVPLRTEWSFARFTDEGEEQVLAFLWDAEEKLQREEESRALTAALKCLQEGVVLANLDGTIRYANPAAAQIYGYGDRREVLGHTLREHVAEGDLPGFEARLERAQTTGGTCEIRLRRPDGGETEVHITISPVTMEGTLIGTIGVIRDLTEAKALARRAIAADKQVTLGRLVAGAAHEINNPLAAILAGAELLRQHPALPAEDQLLVETIITEGGRAGRIVRDLLAFARQRPVTRVATDLAEVVRSAVALRQGYTKAAGIEVTFDTASPAPVHADVDQLTQVVLNLLVNAEDAVSQSATKRITVTIGRRGGQALLLVNDSGSGVPEAIAPQIFEPFFTTKPEGHGTGLGLSVSQGIVAEHGGRISVSRGVLGGAQFAVELPIPATVAPWAEAKVIPMRTPRRKGLRVLLVDDETPILEAIGRILQRLGHDVWTANCGGDALAIANVERFDVILSDLRMPGMGGRELHARLTEDGLLPGTDFIVATGDIADPEAFAFLQATGLPVLLKPFEIDELVEVLGRCRASVEQVGLVLERAG